MSSTVNTKSEYRRFDLQSNSVPVQEDAKITNPHSPPTPSGALSDLTSHLSSQPKTPQTSATRSARTTSTSALDAFSQRSRLASVTETGVKRHIQQMNAGNAQWGIQQTPAEAFAQSHFRRGLCGESCDAALEALQQSGLQGDFRKSNAEFNGETHFFLQTPDGSQVIEPTWKQIVVSHQEEQQHPERCAAALSNFPAVFVGSKEQLAAQVAAAYKALGKSQDSSAILGHWGM
jgi:hypothetical protein